MFSMILFGK